MALDPPIVTVAEPKLAPLFGHPLGIVAYERDPILTGRVVGIAVDLPDPL